MAELIKNNETLLRTCIQCEMLSKKPIFESYKSLCKKLGNDAIEYMDFEYAYYHFYQGNVNLDYVKSLGSKTLFDLPNKILEIIVAKLNSKSRLLVRKVSRKMESLVRRQKNIYDEIVVETGTDFVKLKIGEWWIFYTKTNTGSKVVHEKERIFEGQDFLEMTFNDLKDVIENSNMEIKQLTLNLIDKTIGEKCLEFFLIRHHF